MNAHPFAELHTALTHNGETTNYRTMLNRVSQFNLTPLAQTDTAVASLKLHLVSQYLHYPFDALVESFSPTTGLNLTQFPPRSGSASNGSRRWSWRALRMVPTSISAAASIPTTG